MCGKEGGQIVMIYHKLREAALAEMGVALRKGQTVGVKQPTRVCNLMTRQLTSHDTSPL